MEIALRHELITELPELKNQIFPTNAPETATKPYLVYYIKGVSRIKTFDGYVDKQGINYLYSIMAVRYSDMTRIRKSVEELLLALPFTVIGNNQKFFIEDVDLNEINEQYEHQLGVNRGIIDFTIYFRKE